MQAKREDIAKHHRYVTGIMPESSDKTIIREQFVDPKPEVVGQIADVGKFIVYYADKKQDPLETDTSFETLRDRFEHRFGNLEDYGAYHYMGLIRSKQNNAILVDYEMATPSSIEHSLNDMGVGEKTIFNAFQSEGDDENLFNLEFGRENGDDFLKEIQVETRLGTINAQEVVATLIGLAVDNKSADGKSQSPVHYFKTKELEDAINVFSPEEHLRLYNLRSPFSPIVISDDAKRNFLLLKPPAKMLTKEGEPMHEATSSILWKFLIKKRWDA